MNSVQERELLQVLATMQGLIYSDQCAQTIRQIVDKDIVIFLGNTRSGKSTIVNYCIGNTLRAVRIRKRQFRIEADPAAKGPTIGAGSLSETTIPTAWPSSMIGDTIVDAPGFDDNRGEAQDVANAFYIKELITNANSVKFVLISDINDVLVDNIGQFINFTDKIFTMLPQCGSLQGGMVMVFNKDKEETTKEEICEELNKKVNSQVQIKIKNRCLIEYIVRNPKQIVITKMPEEDGVIVPGTVFSDLETAIKNHASRLSKELLAAVTPGISDRSRVFLLEAHAFFTEFKELDQVLDGVNLAFLAVMEEKDYNINVTSRPELMQVKKNLIVFEEKIRTLRETQLPVPDTLLSIGELLPSIEALKGDSDMYMKLKFVSFVDQILNIEESNILKTKINTQLSKMKDKVVGLRIDAQEKLLEITMEEANRRYDELQKQRHQDQVEHLKRMNELQQRQIEALQRQRQENKKKGWCVLQ